MSETRDKIPHGAYLGSELELDTYETHFNEDLMATKHQELAQAFYSSDFPPAKTFYQGKNNYIGLISTFVQYSNLTHHHLTFFWLSRALSCVYWCNKHFDLLHFFQLMKL